MISNHFSYFCVPIKRSEVFAIYLITHFVGKCNFLVRKIFSCSRAKKQFHSQELALQIDRNVEVLFFFLTRSLLLRMRCVCICVRLEKNIFHENFIPRFNRVTTLIKVNCINLRPKIAHELNALLKKGNESEECNRGQFQPNRYQEQ